MEIRLKQLNKSYKTRDKKTINAVKDISITVPDGKVLCLLGPSGCGKSTLLSLINGLEKPESGEIWFGEKNVTDVSPEKRGVGMVFQNYALYSHMTVRQNIRMPLDNPVRGDALPKEQKEKRVQEVASMLRIEDTLDRRPDELSGGQQQRVSIARALIRKPEILLLDEPLSNLDKRLRVQILNEIRSIQKITGITTVFVTHDQEEAMGIADLIAVMKEGKIQQVGTPNEIYSNPSNVFTAQFLGNPEINLLKGIIKDGGLFLNTQRIRDLFGVKDQEVVLGIRPEDVTVCETGNIQGEIDHIDRNGKDRIVVALVQGRPFHFYLTVMDEPASGSKVCLQINNDKLFVFSKDSGERILF